ncbi:MAG: hypothetical protein WC381_08215 [Kiritimatiellia bacterium]|jgi:phosphoribosylaminoimidazolecarboxamide formyltransferase/IMP cyclohydrolase
MAINFVEQIDDAVRIKNVLVSVSDKAGLEAFIPELARINPSLTLYSTGGTFQALRECLGAGLAKKHLVQVSDYTGQPEMQGGLVKTLDFKIYLGLLSETYNPAHTADLERVQGVAIDMVIVNLYPFAQTIAQRGVTPEQARANIDIGGPCMVRAAAKNFLRVASVTDPADYPAIAAELKAAGGKLALKTRFGLACKAFAHTAAYDAAIAAYLAQCPFDAARKTYRIN